MEYIRCVSVHVYSKILISVGQLLRADGRKDQQAGKWMDGRTDGWADGITDERAGGRTDTISNRNA